MGTENIRSHTISALDNPIRHLSFSQSGAFLSVCGEEDNVKLIVTSTSEITSLHDEKTTYLSTNYDPLGKYIAASAVSGQTILWDIESQSVVYRLPSKVFLKDNTSQLMRFQFSPNGSLLALPGEKKIRIYNRNTWNQSMTFGDEYIFDEATTLVHWLPDSRYLFAATPSAVTLWDIRNTQQNIGTSNSLESSFSLMGLALIPEINGFAAVTDDGTLHSIIDVIPDKVLANNPYSPAPVKAKPAKTNSLLHVADGDGVGIIDVNSRYDDEDASANMVGMLKKSRQNEDDEDADVVLDEFTTLSKTVENNSNNNADNKRIEFLKREVFAGDEDDTESDSDNYSARKTDNADDIEYNDDNLPPLDTSRKEKKGKRSKRMYFIFILIFIKMLSFFNDFN